MWRSDDPTGIRPFETRAPPPVRSRQATGSYRDFDCFLTNRERNWLAMFLQTSQVTRDGIFDIGQGFFARNSLADAAGQRRTFGYEHAILVRLDNDSKFHGAPLNILSVLARRRLWNSVCRRSRRGLDGLDGIDAITFAHSAVHLELHLFARLMVQQRLGHGRKIADNALLRIGIPRAQNSKSLMVIAGHFSGLHARAHPDPA